MRMLREVLALQKKWQIYQCPKFKGTHNYWLQPVGEPLANPYLGRAGRDCGTRLNWAKFSSY